MKNEKHLLQYIQTFFQDYLSAHRGLSANTIKAYRDTLKLLLAFVAKYQKKDIAKLALEDLTAQHILAFLDDIEKTRKNVVITRNLRLAALRTFFSYLATQDTLRCGQYQKIIAIPLKKGLHPSMQYLELQEVKAILKTIDRTKPSGRRDYLLLSLLYNTGARVQEICDLCLQDIRLELPSSIRLIGKGNKIRQVPLWSETATLLKDYFCEYKLFDQPTMRLFLNARKEPLSRFGIDYIIKKRVKMACKHCPSLEHKKVSPHTFRHTTAMHLLQSGVDLTVIKSWLGHVHLETTHGYVEIDLEMKRKALASCAPLGDAKKLRNTLNKNKDIIQWLEAL